MATEGRNFFRQHQKLVPIYSGGSVTVLPNKLSDIREAHVPPLESSLNGTFSNSTNFGHFLILSNDDTLNVLDSESGQTVASFETTLQDPILHHDAGYHRGSTTAVIGSEPTDERGGGDGTVRKKRSGELEISSVNLEVKTEKEELFICCSTQSLQLYLLRLVRKISDVVESEVSSEEEEEEEENTNVKNKKGTNEKKTKATEMSFELSCVRNWTANQHSITVVHFSKNTDYVSSGSADGVVKVWGSHQHFLTHNFKCQGGAVTCISTGRSEQSESSRKVLAEKSKKQSQSADKDKEAQSIESGGETPEFLLVGTVEGFISLFDFVKKVVLAVVRSHTTAVTSLSLLHTVKHHDIQVATSGSPSSLSTSQEGLGGCVVSCGRDRKIVFSDPKTLQQRHAVVTKEYVSCSCICPTTGFIHIGSSEGTVATYQLKPEPGTAQLLYRSEAPPSSKREEGAVDQENMIVSICTSPYCAATTGVREQHQGDSRPAEGTSLSTLDNTGALNKKKKKRRKEEGTGQPTASSIDTDKILICYTDASFAVRFVTHEADAQLAESVNKKYKFEKILVGNFDQILDVALLPSVRPAPTFPQNDEKPRSFPACCVVTNSKVAYVFDTPATPLSRRSLIGHREIILVVRTSADGRYLVTGAKDKEVRVWDALSERCECVGIGTGHDGEITALALNTQKNGQEFMCLTASSDESVILWNLLPVVKHQRKEGTTFSENTTTGAPLQFSPACTAAGGHEGTVHCVSFAPSDKMLASGGKDKKIRVWEIRAGRKLIAQGTLVGHRRPINAVAFSPVDRILASVSNDGAMKLWSLASFSCARTLQIDKTPVLQVAFFNKGTQVVTASSEGLLRFWGIASGEAVCTVDAHTDRVWAMQVYEPMRVEGEERIVGEVEETTVVISGASDGTLSIVEDYTREEADRLRTLRKKTIENEQKLRDALRNRIYEEAFLIALRLHHQRQLRVVISTWAGESETHEIFQQQLSAQIKKLEASDREVLLAFAREWLCNARHCIVATEVVHAFFHAHHFTSVVEMPEVPLLLEALVSYSRRHLHRNAERLSAMYYVDYLCRSIHPLGAGSMLSSPSLSLPRMVATGSGGLPLSKEGKEQESGTELAEIVEDVPQPHPAAAAATNTTTTFAEEPRSSEAKALKRKKRGRK